MNVFLIIVSLYGGIERVPMNSERVCEIAAGKFNTITTRTAWAYCIKNSEN